MWKFYKQGDECGAQQAQTFTIVRTLNEQERANIFGQPPSIQNLRRKFELIKQISLYFLMACFNYK